MGKTANFVKIHGKWYQVLSENLCHPEFNQYLKLSENSIHVVWYLSENNVRYITSNMTQCCQKIHSKYYLMLSEKSSNQQWEFNINSTYCYLKKSIQTVLNINVIKFSPNRLLWSTEYSIQTVLNVIRQFIQSVLNVIKKPSRNCT